MATADAKSVPPARSWAEVLPPASRVRLLILAGLTVFAYWGPIRYTMIGRWIADGNWSHGWLVPAFSLYLLSSKSDELRRCAPRANYVGAVLVAASLALYGGSWQVGMAYPQAFSLVTTLLGLALLHGGWSVLRLVWFPIVFLLFAVPLPQQRYFALTLPLREWASSAAAALLPLLIPGLHTEAQAVVIDYVRPGGSAGQLNVEEACSGMRLMMAFVTLGVAMAYLGARPYWQRAVLVASCVPIAVLCNTIRVTTTGYFTITGRTELAQGTPHQLLGIAMLLIALGCYSLIGYVMTHLFIDVNGENAEGGS